MASQRLDDDQAHHATTSSRSSRSSGPSEERIASSRTDIGGGFGGKVPVIPGYVLAIGASVLTGHPVKWIEDRSENIQADSFARDYHITAELAAKKDGTMQALRVKTIADHGAFDAAANPSKFPAGLFHVVTGSYPFEKSSSRDGAYTNKARGASRPCRSAHEAPSHRAARAVLALELKKDPMRSGAELHTAEAFPTISPRWEYDSGNRPRAQAAMAKR